MFTPTGLLGPTAVISPAHFIEDSPKPSFCPTGLLEQSPVDTLNGLTGPTRAISSVTKRPFVPTGLLEQSLEEPPNDFENPSGSKYESLLSVSFVSNGLLSTSNTVAAKPTPSSPDDLELASTAGAIDAPSISISTSYQPGLRATTYSGRTIYLKQKSKTFTSGKMAPSNQSVRKLLDVPIHRLMDQLSSITAADLQKTDQAIEERVGVRQAPVIADTLWVDKYRPRRFTDLVGNEKVARDALAWVKQWDYCVFGKNRGKKRNRDDENTNQDKYQRPHEKVLLLSGPPGLGKTTLAHVVARQAGYDVMEINASDARSGSIVEDRIRPTLESGSAIGSTKPVLLVIDEIDGATGAGDNSNTFIHKLVHLIQAKPTRKRTKKEQGPRPILRPIICICNDLNASSLAKLRPFAYSIRFYRPADTHIVTRLKEICQVERLKAESRALATLVSAAKGDLRGCLNTLQFIQKRGENVTEPVVRRATSGMKETETNYLAVLDNLFRPLSKKRVKELGMTDDEESRYVSRLSREIEGSGKESNIASGCFGHYATLRRHDATLSRHEQGVEWLTVFDIFTSAMYNDGDFALNQYLPYTLVPFHPLFQQRGGDRVERNQDDWEHFQVTRSNEEILNSFSRCLRNATVRYGGDFRHLLCHPVLQLEFASYINRIISPPLRPVNSQIIRPTEKSLMARLVDIMTALELRFVQEKADDGQLSYRLDPPIDVFVTYDGKRASDITVSRYAVRHLVSGEIEAKLIARDTEFVEKGKKGKHSLAGKSSWKNSTDDNKEDNVNSTTGSDHPNKRQKLDTLDIADRPPTDFFGRPVVVPIGSSTNPFDRKKSEKKFKVSYKFLEGNSAAVRRPVKVNMFL